MTSYRCGARLLTRLPSPRGVRACPVARDLGGRGRQALTDISHAVETSARPSGLTASCSEYTGHFIGSAMHMEPPVPNYGKPGRGPVLTEWHGLGYRADARARRPAYQAARRRLDGADGGRQPRRAFRAHDRDHADGPSVLTAQDGGAAGFALLGDAAADEIAGVATADRGKQRKEDVVASNPSIRASDQDRDRTAALLREHHAVGGWTPRSSPSGSTDLTRQDHRRPGRAHRRPACHRPVPAADSSLPRVRAFNSGLPSAYVRGARRSGPRGRLRGVSRWTVAWSGYAGLLLICLALWVLGAPVPLIAVGVIGVGMLTGQAVSRRAIGRGGSGSGSGSRLSGGQRDQIEGQGDSD